jgi:hypothetical protein
MMLRRRASAGLSACRSCSAALEEIEVAAQIYLRYEGAIQESVIWVCDWGISSAEHHYGFISDATGGARQTSNYGCRDVAAIRGEFSHRAESPAADHVEK